MATYKVTGTISGLNQGVSQQEAINRGPAQCEEQINCTADIAKGLMSRPCSTCIAGYTIAEGEHLNVQNPHSIAFESLAGTFQAQFTRKLDAVDGGITVHKGEGIAQTVNYEAGSLAYLDGPTGVTSEELFHAYAWSDVVMLVNRSVTPAMTASVAPTREEEAIFWIKNSNFGMTYELHYEGQTAFTYTEPIPSSDTGQIKPDPITFANALDTYLTGISADYDRYGTVFVMRHTDIAGVTAVDPNNGKDFVILYDKVESRIELPKRCTPGYLIQYIGKDNDKANDYWLKFVKYDNSVAVGNMYEGYWEETLDPGVSYEIDNTTMPHILERQTDGSFDFKKINWAHRLTGNDETNPLPSFIGTPIASCGLFQGRLWFCAGSNFIMSEPLYTNNFFAKSVRISLSTDPVDVTATGPDVIDLRFGAEVANSLVLTAKEVQYIIPGDKPVTAQNINMTPAAHLHNNPYVQPTVSANRMFFAATTSQYLKYPGYGQITELTIDKQRGTPRTEILTKHVPTYLPADIASITCDKANEILFVLPKNSSKLYVYEYYIDEDKRRQAAWSTWQFKDEILSIATRKGVLLMTCRGNDKLEYRFEVVPLVEEMFGPELDNYAVDTRMFTTPTISGDDYIIDLIADIPENQLPIVIANTEKFGKQVGQLLTVERVSRRRLKITNLPEGITSGEFTDFNVVIGWTFESRYTPSMPLPTDNRGTKYEAQSLLYTDMTIGYKDTGTIHAEVEYLRIGETVSHEFTPKRLRSTVLGEIEMRTGKDKFSVRARYTEAQVHIVRKDTYLPMNLTNIAWTAKLTTKGRRV